MALRNKAQARSSKSLTSTSTGTQPVGRLTLTGVDVVETALPPSPNPPTDSLPQQARLPLRTAQAVVWPMEKEVVRLASSSYCKLMLDIGLVMVLLFSQTKPTPSSGTAQVCPADPPGPTSGVPTSPTGL